jgi:hypothetical protein
MHKANAAVMSNAVSIDLPGAILNLHIITSAVAIGSSAGIKRYISSSEYSKLLFAEYTPILQKIQAKKHRQA